MNKESGKKEGSRTCPSCGAHLTGLILECQYCGFEFSPADKSEALQEFIHRIEEFDIEIEKIEREMEKEALKPKRGWATWGTPKRVGWVILNIYFCLFPLLIYSIFSFIKTKKSSRLSSIEKRKAKMIEDYMFPNDKETLLEVMMFIKSKVTFLSAEKLCASNVYWIGLWANKAQQIYEKAELMFPRNQIIQNNYNEVTEMCSSVRKNYRQRIYIFVGVIVILFVFMLIDEYIYLLR